MVFSMTTHPTKYVCTYDSPIGKLYLAEQDGALTDISYFPVGNAQEKQSALLVRTVIMLDEYFSGQRKSFDLPLALKGTEFQQRAWKVLCDIPYGETRTYKQQAEALGNVKACRAVGAANGKNPISIIVPCHRVIGANNKLVGYAGGMDVKMFLLELEKKYDT